MFKCAVCDKDFEEDDFMETWGMCYEDADRISKVFMAITGVEEDEGGSLHGSPTGLKNFYTLESIIDYVGQLNMKIRKLEER